MRHPKTVLVMTVLIVGNAAAALQAVTLPQPQERHDAAPDIPASEHIAALLCERGLEPEAAEARSRQLFSGPVPTLSQLQRLSSALDGVELAMLEEALVKRALFSKPVDFGSTDTLVRLIQEATGRAVDDRTLSLLHEATRRHREKRLPA